MTRPVIYAAMIGGAVRLWLSCHACGGQIFLITSGADLVRPPCPRCGAIEIPQESLKLAVSA